MSGQEVNELIKGLTKESILNAIRKIDSEGIQNDEKSMYYDVHYNGQLYPPKLVISLAGEDQYGEKIDRRSFHGGKNHLSFNTLLKHGFEIKKKDMIKPFKNVMIYEIKSSANANYHELFDKDRSTFFWNQDKFKNLEINDVVFIINPHQPEILSCTVREFDIKVKVNDDRTYFSYQNEDYNVSGKYDRFLALDIKTIYNEDFKWKSLGSGENTYFYGDKVSPASVSNNLERLNSILDLTSGEDFNILDRCKNLMTSMINEEMFPLIKLFVDQAANTDDQSYKIYSKEYKKLQVKASFGTGIKTHIPWMSFCGFKQTTSNGIYPVFLYYLEENCLILAYGISETNTPERMWENLTTKTKVKSFLASTYNTKAKRYGDSYVYATYDLNQPIDDYCPQIEDDLNDLIDEYYETFGAKIIIEKENNETIASMDINKNTILYGPPGTGKTYETSTLALAIVDKKERSSYEDIDRQTIKDRYKELLGKRIFFTTFHQSFSYQDFVEGLRPKPTDKGDITYTVVPGIFREVCKEAGEDPNENYVLIIDEINRGNVSEILGELITLLEVDKRLGNAEETTVTLPYSRESFGVPSNVFIIGTMNTADRSISLLDTALRRRFSFVEVPPNAKLIKDKLENSGEIDGVDISMLFKTLNNRIEFLLDKDHKIGHSYFLRVKTLLDLKDVFTSDLIPQLEEYFHNDYESLKRVFGDNTEWGKPEEFKLIVDSSTDQSTLFGSDLDGFEGHQLYEFNLDFRKEKNTEKLREFFSKIYSI